MRLCSRLGLVALLLLSVAPAAAFAQEAPPVLRVAEVTPTSLVVELACPGETLPALTATIDGAVYPVSAPIRSAVPLALVVVVETTPVMEESGTPRSTRLHDALTRARALLDRLPPGSLTSLVTFDATARVVLPLTPDGLAVRRALGTLVGAPGALGDQPPALGQALRLAAETLLEAPEGPQALALFAASAADAPVPPLPTGLAAARAVVDLGGADEEGRGPLAPLAADIGALYVPYAAADSAALPVRSMAVDQRLADWVGAAAPLQVRIALERMAPGRHELTLAGCSAPATVMFDVPAPDQPFRLWWVGLGAVPLVAAAMVVAWRRRTLSGTPERSGDSTKRYRAPGAVTTERRITGSLPALEVVVWDGRERRVWPVRSRQITVGRDPGCDVCIPSSWVSGLHARLSLIGDRVEITDMESTNGTLVGEPGRRLTPGVPEPLEAGEIVRVGPQVRFCVQVAASAGADATP
ncbi:MAG: FHA domain-containing protein [Oscillochloridaceae bacterium]|nr:FHA domain-containing protein [Chloroflexaceae bacterium]MDW8390075.1 FHA domain-containing protein [Oscillochloridaceae bacterium]